MGNWMDFDRVTFEKRKNSNLKTYSLTEENKQSWSIPSDLEWSSLEREALNKEFFRYFSTLKSADVRILVSEL